MNDEHVREAEKEGFGEATLGEAQATDPPEDPEMIEEPSEGEAGGGESGTPGEYTGGLGDDASEGGDEAYGGDRDAERTGAAEGGGPHPQEDQAEG
jgi:hypothetical protein